MLCLNDYKKKLNELLFYILLVKSKARYNEKKAKRDEETREVID